MNRRLRDFCMASPPITGVNVSLLLDRHSLFSYSDTDTVSMLWTIFLLTSLFNCCPSTHPKPALEGWWTSQSSKGCHGEGCSRRKEDVNISWRTPWRRPMQEPYTSSLLLHYPCEVVLKKRFLRGLQKEPTHQGKSLWIRHSFQISQITSPALLSNTTSIQ